MCDKAKTEMNKITEIMEAVRFTASKDATVGEVIKQLTDEQIGWIPIVDDDKKLLAYITDGDIIRFISHKRPRSYNYGEHIAIDVDEESFESKVNSLLNIPIMEIANRKHKVFAEVDQDIDEVADLFRSENVQFVAVLDEGRVVGVVREGGIVRHVLAKFLDKEWR